MKQLDHPIIFSDAMVRALLAGTKSQTRRVIKPQPINPRGATPSDQVAGLKRWVDGCGNGNRNRSFDCPYGIAGDRLYVREAWGYLSAGGYTHRDALCYRADDPDASVAVWKSPFFLPRQFTRVVLELTDVRIEALHDISESDAQAEGCASVDAYRALWDSLHPGNNQWSRNPFVWVLTFTRAGAGA